MTAVRAFVCPICGEEFELPVAACRDRSRLLLCPCCGSIEIEAIGDGRSELAPDTDRAVA